MVARAIARAALPLLPLVAGFREVVEQQSLSTGQLASAAEEGATELVSELQAAEARVATPNSDFRCCCDTAEPPICRYFKGICPRASLEAGRPAVQTVKATAAGLAKLCMITGDEPFQAETRSQERKQCDVHERMNEKIFPPEQFSDFALRLALPDIPVAGDVYFAIKNIEIVHGSLFIDFQRKDDRTFSFRIYGDDHGSAVFQLYARDVDLYLSSGLENVAKGLAVTETVFANIFTLGLVNIWADKDYGSLSNLPIKVKTSLSGDFRLNAQGMWEIDQSTRRQTADVQLENGGILMAIINKNIKSSGGVDQIFFDQVWPIVEKLVPPAVGKAFQEVPFESGQVAETLKFVLRCSSGIVSGNTCPGQRLSLELFSETQVKMRPEPITRKLYEEGYYNAARGIAKNMIETYNQGKPVFEGARVDLAANANVNLDKELTVTASPRISSPMGLVTSIVGQGVPLKNFVPPTGSPMVVDGELGVRNGVVQMKELKVEGVTMPVGNSASMQLGFDCDLEMELEDAGGNPNFEDNMIFGRTCVEPCQRKLQAAMDRATGRTCGDRDSLLGTVDEMLASSIPSLVRSALLAVSVDKTSTTLEACGAAVDHMVSIFGEALAMHWNEGEHSQVELDLPTLHAALGMSSGFDFNPLRTDYAMGDRVSTFSDTTGSWRDGSITEVRGDGTFVVTLDRTAMAAGEEVNRSPGQLRPAEVPYQGRLFYSQESTEAELAVENNELLVDGQSVGSVTKTVVATRAGTNVKFVAGIFEMDGMLDEHRIIKGSFKENGRLKGSFRLSDKPTVSVKFAPRFLTDLLVGVGMGLVGDPLVWRNESFPETLGDGPISAKFQYPFATAPGGLDINKLLRTAQFDIGVQLTPVQDVEGEHIDSTVTIEGKADLNVASYVYATFVNNMKPDFGYMTYTAAGMFQYSDELRPGIASLSCGDLRIFQTSRKESKASGQTPFQQDILRQFDLTKPFKTNEFEGPFKWDKTGLRARSAWLKDDWFCLRMGDYDPGLFSSNKPLFFCSDQQTISDLVYAVRTQMSRFKDAANRWQGGCEPGADGGPPKCSHSPDGTWFKQFDPLNPQTWFPGRRLLSEPYVVETPWQTWKKTLKRIFGSFYNP